MHDQILRYRVQEQLRPKVITKATQFLSLCKLCLQPLFRWPPLPHWLRKKRCINALDTFDYSLCVWKCLAIQKRQVSEEENQKQKRNCKAALNLARGYYSDSKKIKGLQNLLILKALQNTTTLALCYISHKSIAEKMQKLYRIQSTVRFKAKVFCLH